jgi:hypothetical protein
VAEATSEALALPNQTWRVYFVAKTNKGRPRRDWRRTVFLIISVLIVLSMVLSMALAFAPNPAP